MTEFVIDNGVSIRRAFFFSIFAAVAPAGLAWFRRSLGTSKASRWFANISIVVTNTIALPALSRGAARADG